MLALVVAVLIVSVTLAACAEGDGTDTSNQPVDDASPLLPTETSASTPTVAEPASTPSAPAVTPTATALESTPTPIPSATEPSSPEAPSPTPTIPIATYGNAEIYVINADGSGERRLTHAITTDEMPQWSPDGSQIAYRSTEERFGHPTSIRVMNVDGSSDEVVQPVNDFGYDHLTWLPDNRMTFFTCDVSGSCSMYFSADGETTRIPLPVSFLTTPDIAWSPDGNHVAYVDNGVGGDGLVMLSVADGSIRQLARSSELASKPAWSPDGRYIVYRLATEEFAEAGLYVVDVDATGTDAEPRLFHHSENGINVPNDPAWSPDGTQLVFTLSSRGSKGTDLWIANIDGSGWRQLTSAFHNEYDPKWSPDGSQIVFVSRRDGGQPVICSFQHFGNRRESPPMETRAWEAQTIVVGTIVEAFAPVFAAPLDMEVSEQPVIVTDYLLNVEQQYRGQTVESTIRLRVEGGVIGDCAQMYDPTINPTIGDRLLLFLQRWAGDASLPAALEPSVQSIWSVTPNDTITSPQYAENRSGYDGMSLDEVHALIVESLFGEPPNDAVDPVSLTDAPITEQRSAP